MAAYYNEIDKYCAEWLRVLILQGEIADGEVDERSIEDVQPADLRGFTQCHFFAGIAGWSLALRMAGWSDDRPVWTGSCPCQPFSSAGKRKGFDDPRHLWPAWHRLIAKCRPPILFGEQVARASDWLALVRGDLEAMEYAMGCLPIEAASVGARHLRDRYWFVADATGLGWEWKREARQWRSGSTNLCPRDHGGYIGVGAGAITEGRVVIARDVHAITGDDGPNRHVAYTQYGRREGRHSKRCGAETVVPSSEVVADPASDGWQQRRPEPIVARATGWASECGGDAAKPHGESKSWTSEPRHQCGFWLAEPNVGGRSDGIPARLDEGSARISKILQDVRERFSPETVQRAPGGPDGIRQEEILQPELRQHARESNEARIFISRQKASEVDVRGVSNDEGSGSASHRSESGKQRSGQHPNVVQPVSRFLARDFKAAWADGSWEDAIPRTTIGVSDRVHKLRAFGNAIVPQVAATFIEAYMSI